MSNKLWIITTFILLLPISAIHAQFEKIVQQYDILSTIAGLGGIDDKGVNGWKSEYEGGDALKAELSRPHFAMADINGIIYIADKDAQAIRKITTDGKIHTVAGTGVSGFDGDGAERYQLMIHRRKA